MKFLNKHEDVVWPLFFFIMCIVFVVARGAAFSKPPAEGQALGSIVGINYSARDIREFYVNDAHGGAVARAEGGIGMTCCLAYPKQWAADLTVKVRWRPVSLAAGAPARGDGAWVEKVVPVPRFLDGGEVYVVFFPGDRVAVHISPFKMAALYADNMAGAGTD